MNECDDYNNKDEIFYYNIKIAVKHSEEIPRHNEVLNLSHKNLGSSFYD